MRTVNCVILGEELEGLEFPPYPGEFGQKIFDNVSKEAWNHWIGHQTMLINENRINTLDPEGRKYLREQCEKYLFGADFDTPEGYVPPSQ
jgi:Fe-S cluster biosynthesis and repair protein YggX